MTLERKAGRSASALRQLNISYDVFSYAPGSVLFELGNTKVLCTVSLQTGVPPFLRGKGTGWLTAEYALLPNATHTRTARENSSAVRNGRTVEISRLISRVLRTVVHLSGFGEQTIYVDCDVLQADGGTRVASISAACLALEQAQHKWLTAGLIKNPFLKERIAAISVGIINNTIVLDPDYDEDSKIDADFNIIITESNRLVEIQGGAEKEPLAWDLFHQIQEYAIKGIETIFQIMQQCTMSIPSIPSSATNHQNITNNTMHKPTKPALFSLANRLSSSEFNQR